MQLRLSLNWCLQAVALAALAATAQAAPVDVAGTVVDDAGAAVASAAVTAYRGGESAASASAKSSSDGSFVLHLPPGGYVIHVEARNAAALTATITVPAAGLRAQKFTLSRALLREQITVTAPGGYRAPTNASAMKIDAPLQEIPQAITVVTREQMRDQLMASIGDAVRYVPGVTLHQGENNRDQMVMRGNASSADFFVDGVRDDVQYYRDLYNLERVEVLKGPNALIFGRGGAGGVLNRVTKVAGFAPLREVEVTGGTFGNTRLTADFNEPLSDRLAFRVNAIAQKADSFRDSVSLQRSGIAPSMTFLAGSGTILTLGYEHFRDRRTADRGITSYNGRPADVRIDTFYGDPDRSHVRADVDLASLSIEHQAGRFSIRNRTLFGAYDRGYQNFVPGAASALKTTVALTAYNNATARTNVFNQLDASTRFTTGTVRHTFLAGAEMGRQMTDNRRNTGYFDDTATSISVPYDAPFTSTPVTFRASATDADNRVRTIIAGIYAQDQAELSQSVRVIAGLRFDRFNLDFLNHRNGDQLRRTDGMLSPRAGVVFTPAAALSFYGSYSVSHLPSSGDQFSTLTSITKQLEPEQFTNRELGVKWNAPSGLLVTAATYRLDRTNTRSTDPNDPSLAIQTGSQRTNGIEVTATGNLTTAWSIAAGAAYQDAFVTSATASARKGARVAQVPRHMLSLWNRFAIHPRVGVAFGVVRRAEMFAAIDDTVILPAYTEVDAAAFLTIRPGIRLQLNVENVFDVVYFANADGNTNISPGSPRAIRVAMSTRF